MPGWHSSYVTCGARSEKIQGTTHNRGDRDAATPVAKASTGQIQEKRVIQRSLCTAEPRRKCRWFTRVPRADPGRLPHLLT